MTIESITGGVRTPTPPAIKTTQKAAIDSGKKAAIKNPERNDGIAITAMAQGIKKAVESSTSVNIVDIDRVATVKQALADGSYQINAERIAGKIIQYEKLMPQDNRT